jgi:RNA polymerase sigma-70 factor (ECF subfamily)
MNDGARTGSQRAGRARDRTVFDQLIGPLIEPAYHVAFAVLHDRQEAEDAVQEAALTAWRKIHQLREPVAARSWFFRIVVNRARMHRRGRWRFVTKLPDLQLPGRWSEDRVLHGVDLRMALRQLAEPDRLLLFLHYGLDLPLEEVAAVLGLSPAGTKTRLYRILKRLRPALLAREGPRDG